LRFPVSFGNGRCFNFVTHRENKLYRRERYGKKNLQEFASGWLPSQKTPL